jgi:hypothetical protein
MSALLVLLEISQWLGFNAIYFIIFKPIEFWVIFVMNNQINMLSLSVNIFVYVNTC